HDRGDRDRDQALHRAMITLKSPREIETRAAAGRIVAETLALVRRHIRPGVSTEELDRLAEDFIRSHPGARPSFKGLYDFPATLCTSTKAEAGPAPDARDDDRDRADGEPRRSRNPHARRSLDGRDPGRVAVGPLRAHGSGAPRRGTAPHPHDGGLTSRSSASASSSSAFPN